MVPRRPGGGGRAAPAGARASLRRGALHCSPEPGEGSPETATLLRAPGSGLPAPGWSEPEIDRLGLIARVVVEPLPGLPPVPARRHHLAQRRRGCEAALSVLVEHHVGD